ncbi:MAG: SAM-dependent methyltransferase [Anaerolineales bacterium]|jgi:hypothetical protein
MTNTEDRTSIDATIDQYNTARYYDYLLGGFHNFAVDRKVGDLVIKACPDIRLGALANRAFLRRAVKFLCQEGIDQFLDIGSGIPTSGNVHDVAQRINPSACVVYVDIDPIAVLHSQAILKDDPNASTIQEDVHNIEKILEHPSFTALIDLHKPLGVLMLSVLHFVKDEEHLQRILRVLKDSLASGSYLVISHYSLEGAPRETKAQLDRLSTGAGSLSVSRTLEETSRLFDGFELVEPGVVRLPLWRPESPEDLLVDQPERALATAGVGRKP